MRQSQGYFLNRIVRPRSHNAAPLRF
jgi:hypothetical protein